MYLNLVSAYQKCKLHFIVRFAVLVFTLLLIPLLAKFYGLI